MAAMRIRLAALAFATAMAASAPALADPHGEAVKLFEEGRKLRDHGELEKAALVFGASITVEPSVGAYFNLGLINEQLGRPREALEAFRKSKELAAKRNDPREKDAIEAVGKLLDARSYVFLEITDGVAATPGLRVVVDGEVVPPAQLKGEVFRGPSSHEIVITATGRADVRIQARNKQVVNVILGEAVAQTAPTPPPGTSDAGWGWQKWTGTGMIAGGVISITAFAIIFLPYLSDRLSLNDKIDQQCPKKGDKPSCPSDEATKDLVADNNENVRSATNKTPALIVSGVLGGLLVGGGIYLLATAPSSAPSSRSARIRVVPQVGLRDNGLTVVGTF
jgi:hypothetical protein